MPSQPTVSVIIPCYNHGRYIGEAVNSVLAQKFQDFEIVIADDCSNDGTTPAQIKEVATKDKRIKIVTLPENKGHSGARNAAIEKAQGIYILPLDADDMIAPTYLKKAVKALDESKGDVIYSMQVQKFGKSNNIMKIKSNPEKWLPLWKNSPLYCSLYEKHNWKKYGGYKSSMRVGGEDWEFWLCFLEDGKKFFGLDGAFLLVRIEDNSASRHARENIKMIVQEIKKLHPKLYNIRNYYLSYPFIITKFKAFLKFLFQARWSSHKKYIRILGVYIINKHDLQ